MRKCLQVSVAAVIVLVATVAVRAALLGVTPGIPKTMFSNPSAITYVPAGPTGAFHMSAMPLSTQFSTGTALFVFSPPALAPSLTIDIVLNSNGTLAGGVAGNDVVLRGKITVPGGGPTYDGTGANPPLLTGEILAFGYLDGGIGFADNYDFRFQVTGGQLAPLYAGQDLGVSVSSDNGNTFVGLFTAPFAGNAKGNLGPIPQPPQQCTGTIGNFVWHDHNRNGIQDVNEEGIDGVTVTLTLPNSTTVTTVTTTSPTGQHGYYQFTGLCAGNYTVTVTTPVGYTPTIVNAPGSTTDNDSNPSPSPVTLPTNASTDQSIDFGFVTPCTGMIGDFVWADLNGNGIQDSGEPGINNVTVQLLDSGGGVLQTTTTSNSPGTGQPGYYRFDGLCAGSYQVKFVNPGGYTGFSTPFQGGDTSADSNANQSTGIALVTLTDDTTVDLTIDAGLEPPCTGMIGDFVWNDLDGNGIQDAGEPGINGVKVELKDGFGVVIQTEITHDHPSSGAPGYYQFMGVCDGSFTVVVTRPPAYAYFSPEFQGTDTTVDSNGTASQDLLFSIAPVTLPFINTSDQTIDFGFYACTGTIGDFVWRDLNGNGKQDNGEPGIPNVTLELLDGNGASLGITAMTDGTGHYLFTGLCIGAYQVRVVSGVPSDLTPTIVGDGSSPTDDSNPNPAPVTLTAPNSHDLTIDFGYVPTASVTITKTSIGGTGEFAFQTAGSGPASFAGFTSLGTLADSTPATHGPDVFSWEYFGDAKYVTEIVPSSWALSSISCSGGTTAIGTGTGASFDQGVTAGFDAGDTTVKITLVPGDAVSCSFTNTKDASLTIDKISLGGTGTFAFTPTGTGPSSFTTFSAITTNTPGAPVGHGPDVFTASQFGDAKYVTESVPAGWTLTAISCTGGTTAIGTGIGGSFTNNGSDGFDAGDATVMVSLAAGDAVSCTFTNSKQPRLTVIKKIVGGNGTTDTFDVLVDGAVKVDNAVDTSAAGTSSGAQIYGIGSHTVSETNGDGTPVSSTLWTTVISGDCDPGTGQVTLVAGDDKTCVVTNTKRGAIRVVKMTNPGGGTGFTFSGDASGTIDHGQNITVSNLVPGTYTASEAAKAGWDLTALSCDDGSSATPSTTDLSARTATFQVDPGETVTCTFTNTQRGTIRVVKATNPAGGVGFSFTGDAAGTINDTQNITVSNLVPGTYSAAEVAKAGWDLTALSCDDGTSATPSTTSLATGTATFKLDPGETVTCTFTNTQRGAIRVVKATNPSGGTGFTFTGDAAGTINDTQSITIAVAPGSYTATELAKTGWDLTALSCDDSGSPVPSTTNLATATATFGVEPGEIVTCTFTNTQRGTIRVVKATNPAGGVGFTFTGNAAGTINDAQNITVSNLAPGTYTSTETAKAGWDLTALSCDDGTSATPSTASLATGTATFKLDPGETVTCTFTNTQRGAIKVVKSSSPAGGTGFTFTGNAAGTINDGQFILVSDLAPGTYTSTEAVKAGWDLTAISCNDSSSATPSTTNLGSRTATFKVDPGETVTCTFTNTQQPTSQCNGVIGDFVWLDLNRNGLQDVGEPGLANVTLTLKNGSGGVMATTTTNSSGGYQFANLCAGTYIVEMTTPAGYDRTAVTVGSNTAIDSNANPATVVLTTSSPSNLTIDFGLVNGFCEKQPVQTELSPTGTHFPSNKGPDAIVRVHLGQSVQTAIDQATDVNGDGYIIVGVVGTEGGVLGGHFTQQVVVNRAYTLPFALIGCSVTLHDPTPSDSSPTARVLSTASAPADGIGARIFLMDLHAEGSAVAGWLVEGNYRYLRNTYGKNNTGVGVKFVGNYNTMHNGTVEGNQGAGLVIQGSNNKATDTDAFSNGSHGVYVVGNTNQILKIDAGDSGKGNGGDGVHVEGAGNTLSENNAYANTGDGVEVVAATGSPNILIKNVAGDRGKANSGNGILVSGPGNGTTSPIELEQNTVKANGLVGIRITGTGHQLKNNVSGGTGSGETNVGCEFLVGTGNVNATGNKANGTTVAGSNGTAFPTSCIGS